MDLATAVAITLTDTTIHLVDSNLVGPLGHGLSALLIGRSSAFKKGIFVIPGLIDADFEGTIKIMVYTLTPPLTIMEGSKIAQLIPFESKVPNAEQKKRGEKGFGSTGQPDVLLALDISRGKPEKQMEMRHPNGQTSKLRMLIDTGADVTIVPLYLWPSQWPLLPANTGILGVGGTQVTSISRDTIAFMFPDGKLVTTRPYVMHSPVALVGRDLLSQMGARLITSLF